jgi:hypothetical protein
MAHLVPSDITHLALAGGGHPELDTLHQFKAGLPDDYTVFHGVHWSREYAAAVVFGELDFVVVNRSSRVLVIEQKNGALEETPGGLAKRYPGQVKLVGDQVRRSLEGIREKFKWQHHGCTLDLDYLVYCPDHRCREVNAAALDPSRIVDAACRERLCARIEDILGPGTPEDPKWEETVLGFFCQSFAVVADVHAHVASQERAYTRLCGPLVNVLAGLEMDLLRLRLYGTAGCGKTLIAQRVFHEAVARGRRPLMVCYNRPLAERLRALAGEGGMVNTFHGLCVAFLRSRGIAPDYHDWPAILERVAAEPVSDAWRFDTLIVDEGQDFEQEWVEILRLFLADRTDMLWLEDPHQNVRDVAPILLGPFVGYRANTNYRTPQSIARVVRRVLPFQFECANTLPGLGVGVCAYDTPENQPALVAAIVDGLLRQGFAHHDIVILTLKGLRSSVFSHRDRVGNFTLRRFRDEYDLFGNQVLTPGQLAFDSVRRFKGQQAPAVILVDVETDPEDPTRTDRLLYTGMTRATVRLDLVVGASDPLAARLPAH